MDSIYINISQDGFLSMEEDALKDLNEEGFFNNKKVTLTEAGFERSKSGDLTGSNVSIMLYDQGRCVSSRSVKWESEEAQNCINKVIDDLRCIALGSNYFGGRTSAVKKLSKIPGNKVKILETLAFIATSADAYRDLQNKAYKYFSQIDGYKAEKIKILASILRNPNLPPGHYMKAVEFLWGLCTRDESEKAQALEAIATSPNVHNKYRRDAVSALGYVTRSKDILKSIVESSCDITIRMEAVRSLGRIQGLKNTTASACLFIATDPNVDWNNRMDAARYLSKIDDNKRKKTEAWKSIAYSPQAPIKYQIEALNALSRRSAHKDEAAVTLASITLNLDVDITHRIEAAKALGKIPGQEAKTAEAWMSIGMKKNITIHQRLEALNYLTNLKGYEGEAAIVCANLIEQDPRLIASFADKIKYSKILLLGDYLHQGQAKEFLRSIAKSHKAKDLNRLEACIMMAELGFEEVQAYGSYAEAMYTSPWVTVSTRVSAANLLALLDMGTGKYQEAMTNRVHPMLADEALSQGAISVLSSLARFAVNKGHEEWAGYMMNERLKIQQAILGLQTKQTYATLAQEIFSEVFNNQQRSKADTLVHLGHYVEDPHIAVWQGNLPSVPAGFKDEALWVANKERLMRSVNNWYNQDSKADRSVSLNAYKEIIGRFYNNLKATKDYKVNPEMILERAARLILHLDGIGRGHRDRMSEKELSHLRVIFEELYRRGGNCMDAAAVGLDYAEMQMFAWDNQSNEKALISIALTFIKRAALQQFSMRSVNAGSQNPEIVEDWLYALNQYNLFCDLGVLGSGEMTFEELAVKRSFDEVWRLFLNAADEQQLVEGIIKGNHSPILRDALVKLSGIEMQNLPGERDYPALRKWLDEALQVLAELTSGSEVRSIQSLGDEDITKALENLKIKQPMPEVFRAFEEKIIEVLKKQLREITHDFAEKLTNEFLENNMNECYAFIEGTLSESIKRRIEGDEQKAFASHIKARLTEYGYLTDKNAVSYRGEAPKKLKVEALQEIAIQADAMPDNPNGN